MDRTADKRGRPHTRPGAPCRVRPGLGGDFQGVTHLGCKAMATTPQSATTQPAENTKRCPTCGQTFVPKWGQIYCGRRCEKRERYPD